MANLALIRELCEKRGISIRSLAKQIGRTETTIQNLMRAGSTNSQTIELIAGVLGVSPGIFFDGFASERTQELEKELAHAQELLKQKEENLRDKETIIEMLRKESRLLN